MKQTGGFIRCGEEFSDITPWVLEVPSFLHVARLLQSVGDLAKSLSLFHLQSACVSRKKTNHVPPYFRTVCCEEEYHLCIPTQKKEFPRKKKSSIHKEHTHAQGCYTQTCDVKTSFSPMKSLSCSDYIFLVLFSGLYYCFNMVIIMLSIFLSSVVINISRRGDSLEPVPNWLRTVSTTRKSAHSEFNFSSTVLKQDVSFSCFPAQSIDSHGEIDNLPTNLTRSCHFSQVFDQKCLAIVQVLYDGYLMCCRLPWGVYPRYFAWRWRSEHGTCCGNAPVNARRHEGALRAAQPSSTRTCSRRTSRSLCAWTARQISRACRLRRCPRTTALPTSGATLLPPRAQPPAQRRGQGPAWRGRANSSSTAAPSGPCRTISSIWTETYAVLKPMSMTCWGFWGRRI